MTQNNEELLQNNVKFKDTCCLHQILLMMKLKIIYLIETLFDMLDNHTQNNNNIVQKLALVFTFRNGSGLAWVNAESLQNRQPSPNLVICMSGIGMLIWFLRKFNDNVCFQVTCDMHVHVLSNSQLKRARVIAKIKIFNAPKHCMVSTTSVRSFAFHALNNNFVVPCIEQ